MYTYEQLEEIANLYGATVLIPNPKDQWRFMLNGHRLTRIDLRFHKVDPRLILYRTFDQPFRHPVHPELCVPDCKGDWLRAGNIEVAFQASLHPQPQCQLSLAGYAETLLVKQSLYQEQNRQCFYCGAKMRFWDATIDHVIPRDRGGGDMPDNYVIACFPCNTRKGNMTATEFKSLLNRSKSLA